MCCLGYEYSETYTEDKALREDEAAAIAEEVESGEIIVASDGPPLEAAELTLRDEPATTEPSQEPAAAQQQQGRKWHPKRKRRKFYQKKAPQ